MNFTKRLIRLYDLLIKDGRFLLKGEHGRKNKIYITPNAAYATNDSWLIKDGGAGSDDVKMPFYLPLHIIRDVKAAKSEIETVEFPINCGKAITTLDNGQQFESDFAPGFAMPNFENILDQFDTREWLTPVEIASFIAGVAAAINAYKSNDTYFKDFKFDATGIQLFLKDAISHVDCYSPAHFQEMDWRVNGTWLCNFLSKFKLKGELYAAATPCVLQLQFDDITYIQMGIRA